MSTTAAMLNHSRRALSRHASAAATAATCSSSFSTSTTASTAHASVVRSLHDFSIEVTPPSFAKLLAKHPSGLGDLLPAGTAVNVTYLPGSDCEETIAVCERIAADGMRPVAHVAARSIESEAHLEGYLSGLNERAGVDEVLVVGGGVDTPKGPFHESMQILESGLLQRHGIRTIGLACHPEGSPDINDDALAAALRQKNMWAAEQLAAGSVDKVYLETQFFFEAEPILEWERRTTIEEGNRLPVRLGIAGPTSIKGLIKFAAMSGVGASARVLTRQAGNLFQLTQTKAPDSVIVGLAEAIGTHHDAIAAGTLPTPLATSVPAAEAVPSMLEGFHFYSFAGVAKTAKWARGAADGDFTFGDGEETFTVQG